MELLLLHKRAIYLLVAIGLDCIVSAREVPMFLSVDVALNVDYTRVRKLILVLGARMIIVELVLLLVSELDIAFNSLIGLTKYLQKHWLFSNSFSPVRS